LSATPKTNLSLKAWGRRVDFSRRRCSDDDDDDDDDVGDGDGWADEKNCLTAREAIQRPFFPGAAAETLPRQALDLAQ
jgi:hypothetical protein